MHLYNKNYHCMLTVLVISIFWSATNFFFSFFFFFFFFLSYPLFVIKEGNSYKVIIDVLRNFFFTWTLLLSWISVPSPFRTETGTASTNHRIPVRGGPWEWTLKGATIFLVTQKIQLPVSLFSEFGHRQSLEQDMADLLFQYSDLGKASTNDKCHLVNLWGRTCQYQCVCKIKIFPWYKRLGQFTFFGPRQSLDQDKWHLVIPWVRSCQHQYVCKIWSVSLSDNGQTNRAIIVHTPKSIFSVSRLSTGRAIYFQPSPKINVLTTALNRIMNRKFFTIDKTVTEI